MRTAATTATAATAARTTGAVAMWGGQGASSVTAARASDGTPFHARDAQPIGASRTRPTTGSAHSTARACTVPEAQARPRRSASGSRPARTAANRAIPQAR